MVPRDLPRVPGVPPRAPGGVRIFPISDFSHLWDGQHWHINRLSGLNQGYWNVFGSYVNSHPFIPLVVVSMHE